MTNAFFINRIAKRVEFKSREFFSYVIVIAFSGGLFGCGDDQIQIPNKKLEGKIGTEEWISDKGNAYLFSSDFKYKIKLLSSKEPGSDPCAIPSPSKPYLSAIFQPSIGSFAFSTVVADPNQVIVKIHPSFSEEFIIINGFMEIYAIDNFIIFGFIQAILDDENTVEGTFEVRFCN